MARRLPDRADDDCSRDVAPIAERVPDRFERDLRGIGDVLRNPTVRPLATVATVVVLAAVAYQALVAARTVHPAVGLLVVGVAAGAYLCCKRLWAIQHRYLVRQLALAGTCEDEA